MKTLLLIVVAAAVLTVTSAFAPSSRATVWGRVATTTTMSQQQQRKMPTVLFATDEEDKAEEEDTPIVSFSPLQVDETAAADPSPDAPPAPTPGMSAMDMNTGEVKELKFQDPDMVANTNFEISWWAWYVILIDDGFSLASCGVMSNMCVYLNKDLLLSLYSLAR